MKKEIKTFPFASIERKAKVAQFFWGVIFLMAIVAITSTILEINFLYEIENGKSVTDVEAASNDERQMTVAVIQMIIEISGFIVFLVWYHRAYKNLGALGFKPKTTPGWAVGDFFIPFLNLFEPYRRMKEIWTGTFNDPEGGKIWIWWIVFIAPSILARIAAQIIKRGTTPNDFMIADGIFVLADLLTIVGAVLTIQIIRKVSEKQEHFKTELIKSGKMSVG